jgi:pectinesterase
MTSGRGGGGGGATGASGGATGGPAAGRGGSTAGTGGASAGASGTAGSSGGSAGSGGGIAGSGGAAGAGGSRGGTTGAAGNAGGAGGSSGGSRGGTTGTGGTAGATGSAGTNGACASPIASTATRPQLSSADAANYTIAKYLASGSDAWDPTAGLGDASSFTASFTVAADGSGTHTTVQAAVNAATGTARRYILIKPGTYRGVVSISGSTPITLYGTGTDATKVVIVNGASAGDAGGTAQSSTFTSKAAGLQLMNLTVSNDFAAPASGSNIQAVALYATGDKTVLQNVRLHGFQDTLYVDSPSPTAIARVYIKDSFIEGDTDFMFGRAVMVIDGGEIHYLSSRKGTGSGVHFAPSTHVDNMYGFLATQVNFTADAGAPSNKISLGRSWDQSSTTPTPNGQATIRESVLGAHINKTAPWAAAATSGRAYSATGNRFYEYCNSGPGAGP